jgi:hypothetical protein
VREKRAGKMAAGKGGLIYYLEITVIGSFLIVFLVKGKD